ncbi:MAG: hypothetical protein Hals2KO_03750 [Halioglobus sp.]
MHRYSVDNAVTYTPNDFVLFRESPFALWMERLTLENPDHGIPPDVGSVPPREETLPQDEIVDTLREEGRDVVLVDWDMDESSRRSATLDAMRQGADFIVNGLLALGSLSANANLLMRTSGYSDLGDYLYIPCDTQAHATEQAAFRLCFLADLLQSLQGQLPPQMLLIRGDADVVPLQTEDHIYYFRAVKTRFLQAMDGFRKHRMPDPAESAHFGRWSECASEVLKQRALSAEQRYLESEFDSDLEAELESEEADFDSDAGDFDSGKEDQALAETTLESPVPEPVDSGAEPVAEEGDTLPDEAQSQTAASTEVAEPSRAVPDIQPREVAEAEDGDAAFIEEEVQRVSAAGGAMAVNYAPTHGAQTMPSVTAESADGGSIAGPAASNVATLAEQARQLSPEALKPGAGPGRTPNLAQFPLRKRALEQAGNRDVEAGGERPAGTEAPAEQGSPAASASSPAAGPEQAGLTPGEVSAADFFDDTLQNLAFIGSAAPASFESADEPAETTAPETAGLSFPGEPSAIEQGFSAGTDTGYSAPRREPAPAPSPTLREVAPEPRIEGYEVEMIDLEEVKREASEPHLLSPERVRSERSDELHPAAGQPPEVAPSPFVDLDSAPPPTLMPVKLSADERARVQAQEDERDPGVSRSGTIAEGAPPRRLATRETYEREEQPGGAIPPSSFSSSLITNHDYGEDT